MSGKTDGSASRGRQIVVSGVGGQGVLFVTRLLADAAILRGMSVLTSETHGMAQRGGVVTSHLKAGDFSSPLVRAGMADVLMVLKEENLSLHGAFVSPGGSIVVNSASDIIPEGGRDLHSVDADDLARESGNPQAANLVLLGFALSRLGTADRGGAFFCSPGDVREALGRRGSGRQSFIKASIYALDLGIVRGKR